MARAHHILAIFTFSPKVAVFIQNANAFIQALTTSPGNTRVTIPAGRMNAIKNRLKSLGDIQAKVSARRGATADDRDLIWNAAIKDIRYLVRLVQQAADDALNEQTAITIITDCVLKARKGRVLTKYDIRVFMDKKISRLVRLYSAATKKGLLTIYEWQVSRNGASFTTIVTDTKARTKWLTDAEPGTKLYFRKRHKTHKDKYFTSWSQVVYLYVV